MKEKYINDFVNWPLCDQGHIALPNGNMSKYKLIVGEDTDIAIVHEAYVPTLMDHVDKYHELLCKINEMDDDIVSKAIDSIKG